MNLPREMQAKINKDETLSSGKHSVERAESHGTLAISSNNVTASTISSIAQVK